MNYDEQIEALKKDKWLNELQPLIKSNVSKTRHHFMLSSAFQYILLELEKVPKDESTQMIQDGFKVEALAKKWNAMELATFIDRVSLLATTKMLEHVILIIKKSNISQVQKKELINEIIKQDVTESWHTNENTRR